MKSPKQFDLTFLSGPHKGETCPGIYQRGDLDPGLYQRGDLLEVAAVVVSARVVREQVEHGGDAHHRQAVAHLGADLLEVGDGDRVEVAQGERRPERQPHRRRRRQRPERRR